MPRTTLDTGDAIELAELLQFLAGWLARDPGRLGASLADYAGHPASDVGELRQDLDRFTFLLGGDDGESLFGPGQPTPCTATIRTCPAPARNFFVSW
jgi:hypothetical protein